MKKVLIALDYNPTAQKVAETGYSLAKSMHAEVILFHVVSDISYYSSIQYSPIMGYTGIPMDDAGMVQIVDEKELKKEAENFLDRSKKHLGDDNISILTAEGDCADSIIKTAHDLHVDIIVIGSHSMRWLEKILMGSITEKVLHHSKIPLFIVPTGNK